MRGLSPLRPDLYWQDSRAPIVMFPEFPKIARLSRNMVVTEKIDGTNASVFIRDIPVDEIFPNPIAYVGDKMIYAGSRTRWITPENDNYGFARWVKENAEQLAALGPGHHFGEWWGKGIQRGYGLDEKRFSLFNTSRWTKDPAAVVPEKRLLVPECVHVVPVLREYVFDTEQIEGILASLVSGGSIAAPGFMRPEGVVVYHVASNTLFKKTLDKNDGHKAA
jgi:hypothetical protein